MHEQVVLLRRRLALTAAPLAGAAGASGAGLVADRVGLDVPLGLVALLGALLGVMAVRPVRLRIERWSTGPAGVLTGLTAALLLAAMLTLLGLSVLVPAVVTSTASYSVQMAPTRARVGQNLAVILGVSALSLGAHAGGLVDGVIGPTLASLLGATLLLFTLPTLVNTADGARRAERTARALDAERHEHVRELEHAARHDQLTGLLSRRGLAEPLDRAATGAAPAAQTAVLFIDLDGFKAVNDAFGHAAGDELLVAAARRLRRSVREDDVVARTGGDEFVVVMSALSDAHEAEATAERIRVAIARPFALAAGPAHLGASTGVVVTPTPRTAEALLAEADAAMYAAKRGRQGRARVGSG
ncbi:diguanylate cyclase domain-containing protein [Kineococcus gynurae]|uniref:Diguanylate cyclase domain-containing protein n=1 Tax=Kineococcus gynurae TaxID=452979 RepID=A0ABV5LSQ1_9ACTN